MTNLAVPAADPRKKRLTQSTFLRAMIVAGFLATGVGAMHAVERMYNLTFDKPPMPLSKPLILLEKNIAHRYVAEGFDASMSEEVVAVLGTKDYLLRRYVDKTKPSNDPTASLNMNLNYYATGDSTPHVPEICWAATGMVEAKDVSKRKFTIPGVRRNNGQVIDLQMVIISFYPHTGERNSKYKNVAYCFAVNDEYVATPKEVVSKFWRASNKYAYDTKIEIAVGDPGQYTTQEEAQAAVAEFMRVALPEIEKCLPDPNFENAAQGATTSPGHP
jgi:hypothetical protein